MISLLVIHCEMVYNVESCLLLNFSPLTIFQLMQKTLLIFFSSIVLFLNGCSRQTENTPVGNLPAETSNLSLPQHDAETKIAPDFVSIVGQIESSFGEVERDKNGAITGVNLAKERSSVSDGVLRASLQIPRLKKLRVAGGAITSETLRKIAGQKNLEELYLQDTPIQDGDLAVILPELSQLQRLTLRGCNNVTDQCAESILVMPRLRSLAFVKMNLTRRGLEKIVESPK
ncbi:MAG: hypothetical protein LBT05_05510, partial [Planctomycetaceae bacterium]|nr:hypothetical protein [Planctomycetaceae bacterium]